VAPLVGLLREHDAQHRHGLEETLVALLTHPAGKSTAAESLHLSRPVFYDRLSRIERLLGIDLNDPDARVSLHVALIADQISRLSGS